RLLPAAALFGVALEPAPPQPARPPAGDLLLPPLGSGPRAAARGARRRQVEIPPLPQAAPHRAAAGPPAERFPLAARGAGVRRAHRGLTMSSTVHDRLADHRASGTDAAAVGERASASETLAARARASGDITGPVTVTTAIDGDARAWSAYVDAHSEG